MMQIDLTDEQHELFEELGSHVYLKDKKYMFLPFWVEQSGDNFYVHSLGSLPKELLENIESARSSLIELDTENPLTEDECEIKCQCKESTFTRTVDANFNPLCGKCGLNI